MLIRDINPKATMFVKLYDTPGLNRQTYIVEEKEHDGIVTISVTKDPLKARLYTVQEAYKDTLESLDSYDRNEVSKSHLNKDAYNTLSRNVNKHFRVVTTDTIDYGYSEDFEAELEIFKAIELKDVLATAVQTVVEDIDNE